MLSAHTSSLYTTSARHPAANAVAFLSSGVLGCCDHSYWRDIMCRLSGRCLVLLSPLLAFAHHGGAEYDLTKTVQFQGKLTHVDLINPHAWIYFDVTDSDGKISPHRCEMRSVHVLRRSGGRKRCFLLVRESLLKPPRTARTRFPATCKAFS